MNTRCRLPTVVLVALIGASIAVSAKGQEGTTGASSADGKEMARSERQGSGRSFWDGIVSSILDLFDDGSSMADSNPKPDPRKTASETATEDRSQALDSTASENAERERLTNRRGKPFNRRNRGWPLRRTKVEEQKITPSHVYQATVDLVSEVRVLRDAMEVIDNPRPTNSSEHKTPIHIYAKILEVKEKTARIQRRLGMVPVSVEPIPGKALAQSDVYRGVQTVIEELRRIKRQMVVKHEIRPAPFVGGKVPSQSYENLLHASLLLDGVVGRSTTANDVFLRIMRMHDEMQLIADELEISLLVYPPAVEGAKEPMAVAQQIVRAANKVIHLQSQLGMATSSVPNYTLGFVTSADLLEATNFLLAELARIKAHLHVELSDNGRSVARNKTTTDVFAEVLLVIKNLDIMSKAADVSG